MAIAAHLLGVLLSLASGALGAVDPAEFPPALKVHDAAHAGDLEALKTAITTEPQSVTARTVANLTALHLGIKFPEIVSELLDKGADFNAVDLNSETPLMLAARHGEVQSVEKMVTRGADCALRRADGYTALHLAVQNGACSAVPYLLRCEADPNMVGPEAFSALTMAAADKSEECLTELLKPNLAGNGRLEVDEPTNGGQTALMIACNNHFPDGVKMLITAGATMAAFDDNGTTPLMHAVLGNSLLSLTHILATQEGAANLEVRNAAGSTALMLSSRLPFGKEYVRKLLDAGADPDSRGELGTSDELSNTPLMMATHEKDVQIVSMLLDAGADPSLQSAEGFTALHIAAMEELPEIAQRLLEAGAPQDAKTRDQKMTPFGMAAEYGLQKVIDVFREYNGETFAQDEQVAKHLTFDTFSKEIDGSKALVFFYAPWCGHCKKLHPVWEQLARTVKSADLDIVVAKIDATQANVASTFKVSEYPTIQLFKRNAEEGKPWKGARFYDALMHIVDTQFEAETTEEEQTAEPDATPKSEL